MLSVCVIISGCIGLTYVIPKVSELLFESISNHIFGKCKELKGKTRRIDEDYAYYIYQGGEKQWENRMKNRFDSKRCNIIIIYGSIFFP